MVMFASVEEISSRLDRGTLSTGFVLLITEPFARQIDSDRAEIWRNN